MTATPLRRRTVLRAAVVAGGAVVAGCTFDGPSDELMSETGAVTSMSTRRRILLVVFSRPGENYHDGGRRVLTVGNTEALAGMISGRLRCDVYRIEAADPYPHGYDATVVRNAREQRNDDRPGIVGGLPDVRRYDTILLGCPVWNTRAPMILATFLEGVDLAGKDVFPFVTYATSGLGSVPDDIAALAPDADMGKALAVRGEEVSTAGSRLESWLRKAGIAR